MRFAHGSYSAVILLFFGATLVRFGEPVSSRAQKSHQKQRTEHDIALPGERQTLVIRIFRCQKQAQLAQTLEYSRTPSHS